jgi:chromate transporter
MLTTWVTFVPCFLWIFLGAPYVEKLRGNRALTNMLTGITAAIVGVIMNLALWFGLHVIFGTVTERELPIGRIFLPELSSVSWPTLALSAGAVLAVLRFKTGLLPTLGASALIGIAFFYLG